MKLATVKMDSVDKLLGKLSVNMKTKLGDCLKAEEDAADLEHISPATERNTIKAACVYTLCCGAADKDGRHEDAEGCAKKAIALLKKLHDEGHDALNSDYTEYRKLKLNDDYLKPLRERQDFKDLLPKP